MPTTSRSDRDVPPAPQVPPAEPNTPALRQRKLATALRDLLNRLTPRFSWSFERSLYRAYYALPGLSDARKRGFIEWLHSHAGWLTRNTLSYKVHTQVQELRAHRTNDPAGRQPRMDQVRADALLARWQNPPSISITVSVRNVEPSWLRATVDSVQRQFYPHWQLCIADDASTRADTRKALDEIAALHDQRIRIRRLDRGIGVTGSLNVALELASGDYVGLLEQGDELARDALLEMARTIIEDEPDLLYSDEDQFAGGRHVEPRFKSDYNEDLFFSTNYLRHFCVIRQALLAAAGGFRPGFDGAHDYDLLLRVTERTDRIAHVPKVLYHERKGAGAATPATTAEIGRQALTDSLRRRGIEAEVELGPVPLSYHVRRVRSGEPLVSIIVPFRDKPDLLRACVNSILEKTTYKRFELIGVDNESTDPATRALIDDLPRRDRRLRFIRYEHPFNYSALNNFAVKQVSGEHLLFLNNDTRVKSPDWIETLLEHSQRPDVGAVGAKLLYPNNTLQHAGVIVGIAGVAGHPYQFLPAKHPGYLGRAQLTQNLSAVTFACAMTRREVFEQLGGLNQTDLTIAFNDVDYCLRAREAGYLIVYTPNAILYHDESRSRGIEDNREKQKRFEAEMAYFQRRHADSLKKGDPYYNPNLSLLHAFVPADDYAARLPM